MAQKRILETDDPVKAIREAAEADLATFIRLVQPKQVLGSVHEELCRWWTRQDAKAFQLVLLPRDHGKSRMVAYRVAWMITKKPWIRILYISSTSNLAEKQLKFIKDILTSSVYRRYWPEMVHPDENKRERWTNTEISVDHPKRKEEAIRDPTVFTAGLTTSIVGMHCDIAVLDDVVTGDNSYTDLGRETVKTQYSYLSSIEGADAQEWVVGTRYHPKDLYSEMMEMGEVLYDDEGYETGEVEPIYEKFERAVEDSGDGTGEFLWPRQQRSDGVWFGFDRKVLAIKRGKYLDRTQFRAQYYNDPNDPGEMRIGRDKFQYYDKSFLSESSGNWYYHGNKLNIFASIDFAYSTSKRADYTAIVVIGVDADWNIYVLEIRRFKTTRIKEYFDELLEVHSKWGFKKLAAEVTAAQQAIVEELKDSYIKPYGLYLSVVPIKPTKNEGTKEERLAAILEPKYDNRAVWHYKGGNCQVLEDELVSTHPPHDDCMDALATAIDIAVPPTGHMARDGMRRVDNIIYHKKFGGVLAGRY
jgi:phage terminase large subunit-like protein